jgi:hypothetical protein
MAYTYKSVITKSPAVEVKTEVAGGTLEKFTFVKYDANGKIVVAVTGNKSIGIVQQDAVLNDEVSIITRGESFMATGPGDVFTKGGNVTVNATGKGKAPSAGQPAVAVALEDVAVAGEYYIKVDVIPSI